MDPKPQHQSYQEQKIPVKGKRPIVILVILIIIIIFLSQILYSFVIPRVTLDLKTIYHEATSGGGTGGLINVNTKATNSGTVEVRDFQISVDVLNSTRDLLVNDTYEKNILLPGQSYELKVATNGNCLETFYIIVEVQFKTSNDEYYEKFMYKTHEDAMNIGFEDTIFDWGF
jgi:hypothetical protein